MYGTLGDISCSPDTHSDNTIYSFTIDEWSNTYSVSQKNPPPEGT